MSERRAGFRSVWRICALAGICLIPCIASGADLPERFKVFGHLTQAYGKSTRGAILGTTEDGTAHLSNVAIQFRWEVSESELFIVQFSHEDRREDFVTQAGSHDVEVDWAFYEKRFAENTKVKVGRLNIDLGIYNQVRDVGTVLPFFEPPISFYAGVDNSAETVDGFSVTHDFAPRSDWNLEAEVYFGSWDAVQLRVSPDSKFGTAAVPASAEDGLGLQLWLNTPVEGLRIGAGTLGWRLEGQLSTPGATDRWETYHASLDASGERWMFRAETRHWRFDQDFGLFLGVPSARGKAEREGVYVQAGGWLTPEIGIFGQFESVTLENSLNLLTDIRDFHRDMAISVNYRFSPDLLARIEYHTAETHFPLGEPRTAGSPPADVDWMILALSVSF